jgi:hypothetical protein
MNQRVIVYSVNDGAVVTHQPNPGHDTPRMES